MNDKKQLAAMGAEMAEQQQQPLCMAKRIEELEEQVQVMAELLREAQPYVKDCSDWGGTHDIDLRDAIDAALVGKLPTPVAPEGWHLEALDNGCIVVRKDGVGFYVSSFNAESIASTILHALASDMLSAAPKPEAK